MAENAYVHGHGLRRPWGPPLSDSMPDPEPSSPTGPAPAAAPAADGPVDPDTCRICRGEGTADEPLFYPCKCSGSIKFVHQDCLMEWLSHSQKKHCELCKTPFRFTKLYAPNMPRRLPFHIFLSHLASYLFRNLLVWLRAALVASVWLGWLPYLMRSVWSLLFWISDEGFGPASPTSFRNASSATLVRGADTVSLSVTGTTTCPSTPLLAATTTSASIAGVVNQIPVSTLLKAISKPLNLTATQSWLSSLLRLSVGSSNGPERSALDAINNSNISHIDKITVSSTPNHHASLLSDVAALKNLTRHPAINRTVIAVLEGQIITVLVIVCFILIILVRDYVVQQQPEINMRAAFAAAENEAAPFQAAADARDDPAVPGPQLPPEHDGRGVEAMDGGNAEGLGQEAALHHRAPAQRPIARARRRQVREHQNHPQPRPEGAEASASAGPANTPAEQVGFAGASTGHDGQLESMPAAEADGGDYTTALEGAMEGSPSQSTVSIYLRIYRLANGDRDEILRIIQEEGLEDRLQHWVRITQSMPSAASDAADDSTFAGIPAGFPSTEPLSDEPSTSESDGNESRTRSGAWVDVGDDSQEGGHDRSSRRKGKEVEIDATAEGRASSQWEDAPWSEWEKQFDSPAWPRPSAADPSPAYARPRAVSDGPQRHETINPLANNSWSFANLPADPEPEAVPEQSTVPRPGNSPYVQAQSVSSYESALDLPHSTPEDTAPNDESRDHLQDGSDHRLNTPEIGQTEPNQEPVPREAEARQQPGIGDVVAEFVDFAADFMWGDMLAGVGDDLDQGEAVDIFGDNQEPQFALEGVDEEEQDDGGNVLNGIVDEGADPGFDADALEDAEDFEGIMELIGMRGPLAGLFQNAIFCAFLVSFTIFLGIFVPYNMGRLTVWIVANPVRLAKVMFSVSRFLQDVGMFAVGVISTFFLNVLELSRQLLKTNLGREGLSVARHAASQLSDSSLNRIADSLVSEMPLISATEIRNFSAVSHEALIFVKSQLLNVASQLCKLISFVFTGDYAEKLTTTVPLISDALPVVWNSLCDLPHAILRPDFWKTISLSMPDTASTLDPALSYWDAKDRMWAVLAGYVSISVAAGLYLGRGRPFSSAPTAQDWEASVIDALNQASGVMKVILIISIEMLVFPLYCGLLLDFALLPLFEDTTLKSRLLFTYNFPLTSIFVHWFVGTGYMFHFALFVSMCRKIMRKGVLYFIRDPDDPEFHPVRDVLERNVATQLRKIMFSAFVYGALVVVCLGGVVWGLWLAVPNVLPVHYSSNEPVLEFPIDLLFYNFLMPLAVRFFKPSDGLHVMYTWWFRRCARGLRLTWFLFGERRVDEEGRLALAANSEHRNLPSWSKWFLEVDNQQSQVVPKTWLDTFEGGKKKPITKVDHDEMFRLNMRKARLVESGQLKPDGRFVRAPASDQVKIPKGTRVFFDVTEQNVRTDNKADLPDSDLYSGAHYQFVYVPPWFRLRIFLFILSIWIFAAVTGVSFTIVPLVFGRRMFKALIPSHIRTNDIYAFSIGIYILGSISYFAFHLKPLLNKARNSIAMAVSTMLDQGAVQRAIGFAIKASRLAYTYTCLLVIFPLLITLLMELYVLVPLHTYMYSPLRNDNALNGDPDHGGHTIRVIQAWTLGILYLKLGSRAVTLCGGRPANAVRAVLRNGWLEPEVGVLTRAFVIPGVSAALLMLLMPPIAAKAVVQRLIAGGTTAQPQALQVYVYRMAYPAVAGLLLALLVMRKAARVFEGWQVRIRDEAYLMGERLHNFGGVAVKSGGAWKGTRRV